MRRLFTIRPRRRTSNLLANPSFEVSTSGWSEWLEWNWPRRPPPSAPYNGRAAGGWPFDITAVPPGR